MSVKVVKCVRRGAIEKCMTGAAQKLKRIGISTFDFAGGEYSCFFHPKAK